MKTPTMRLGMVLLATLLSHGAARGQGIESGEVLLADDFDRFQASTADLGALPGGVHRWVKRVPSVDGRVLDELITGNGGSLRLAYSSGNPPHDTGVAVEGFSLADGVISLVVGPSRLADRGHRAIVSYRAVDAQAAAGGMAPGAYHVELSADWTGSRDVILRYGSERLAVADLGPRRDPVGSERLRVSFCGDHHQVHVNDALVIDVWEPQAGRSAAGALGFGGFYSVGSFDDFRVEAARPAAASAAGRGDPWQPLWFQGRPFFVLGTFDLPRPEDMAEWLDAGGNAAIVDCAREADPAARAARIRAWIARAEEHSVALIYYPLIDLYGADQGGPTVPTAAAAAPLAAVMREVLQITAADPRTLGYWTFDEPENHLYKAYKEWDQRRDVGLAEWMAGGYQWLYDLIKEVHPAAYVMPTLGWWTTYEPAAAMYDVNVPNAYPQQGAPLSADLFQAVFDAAKAAEAVRSCGRTGFVYMPPCFDVIQEPYRAATLAEMRYLCFGPLTQGAQGLLPWRLNRATPAYRRAVVYPVMRQVKALVPWLLGQACPGRVRSSADAPTAEYLQKLPLRVRTVIGEAEAEKVAVDGLNDCSHCLRRRPDNSYLLLAVSNRREPLSVTFTLDGLGTLPETALEALEHARTPIVEGRIETVFEPFGVRAWIIEPL